MSIQTNQFKQSQNAGKQIYVFYQYFRLLFRLFEGDNRGTIGVNLFNHYCRELEFGQDEALSKLKEESYVFIFDSNDGFMVSATEGPFSDVCRRFTGQFKAITAEQFEARAKAILNLISEIYSTPSQTEAEQRKTLIGLKEQINQFHNELENMREQAINKIRDAYKDVPEHFRYKAVVKETQLLLDQYVQPMLSFLKNEPDSFVNRVFALRQILNHDAYPKIYLENKFLAKELTDFVLLAVDSWYEEILVPMSNDIKRKKNDSLRKYKEKLSSILDDDISDERTQSLFDGVLLTDLQTPSEESFLDKKNVEIALELWYGGELTSAVVGQDVFDQIDEVYNIEEYQALKEIINQDIENGIDDLLQWVSSRTEVKNMLILHHYLLLWLNEQEDIHLSISDDCLQTQSGDLKISYQKVSLRSIKHV